MEVDNSVHFLDHQDLFCIRLSIITIAIIIIIISNNRQKKTEPSSGNQKVSKLASPNKVQLLASYFYLNFSFILHIPELRHKAVRTTRNPLGRRLA